MKTTHFSESLSIVLAIACVGCENPQEQFEVTERKPPLSDSQQIAEAP